MRKQTFPAPEEAHSDDTLKEYIKNTVGCVFHPVGTASMLPKDDGGVVDPELRVYGTANVRVVSSNLAFHNVFVGFNCFQQVDASILPIVRVCQHVGAGDTDTTSLF